MWRVRRATTDDLGAIAAIYNHAIEHTVATFDVDKVTLAERRVWYAQFDDVHPLFVCDPVAGGAVAGYAYYLPFRQKAAYARTKECTVYVAPEAHRRGVGTALYTEIVAHARTHGVHALVAVLGGDNLGSAALHRKHGFVEVGRLREVGYKLGAYIDTHYFEFLLADPSA